MKLIISSFLFAFSAQAYAAKETPKDLSAALTCDNGVTCDYTYAGGGLSCSNGVSCTNSMGDLNCTNGASCTYTFGNLNCSTETSPCDN